MSNVLKGVVAFSNLTEHDFFQGKDTGNFTLTVTTDAEGQAQLEAQGVKVKIYEGTPQRKFKSQYTTEVVNLDDTPFLGEIPFGSEVRVLYTLGKEHKEHGVPVYMQKIRLVKISDSAPVAPEEF